jgi:hypothetical protein
MVSAKQLRGLVTLLEGEHSVNLTYKGLAWQCVWPRGGVTGRQLGRMGAWCLPSS